MSVAPSMRGPFSARSASSLWVPDGPAGSSLPRPRGIPRVREAAVSRRLATARAQRSGSPQPGGNGGGRTQYDRTWEQTGDYDYAPPPGGRQYSPPPPNYPPPSGGPGGGGDGGGGVNNTTKWLLGASFVLGVGAGVFFDNEVNFVPQNVASTEIIDRRTPNSEICMANGYAAMVFDQRIFVSFNPFNVYVTQPEVKPGCVLRKSNVGVLEDRKLVDRKEVEVCKKSMNNFAFVGDLNNNPEVSCVYHSEDAENQYLVNPKRSVLGDGVQIRNAPPLEEGLIP